MESSSLASSANDMTVPKRQAVMVFALALGLATCLQGNTGSDTDGQQDQEEVTNSLGMVFRRLEKSHVYLSIWETRVSDWNQYCRDTQLQWQHSPAFAQSDEHPIVNITLEDAEAFSKWLTRKETESQRLKKGQLYRLPTNEEWDAAVSSTNSASGSRKDGSRFPWGDQWPPDRQAGNYNTARIEGGKDDGFEFTAPVGQFAPTPGGFYDLGGNVWEWTADVTHQATDASLRGGSWLYWRKPLLSAGYVYRPGPAVRSATIGFRLVLDDTHASAEAREISQQKDAELRKSMLSKSTVGQEEVQRRIAELKSADTPITTEDKEKAMQKKVVTEEEVQKRMAELRGVPPEQAGTDAKTNPAKAQSPP